MNLMPGGSAVSKLQQKQVLKQQKELDKRRKKGGRLHGEAGAAVCIQRWFRNNRKARASKQQQQQQQGAGHDSTICGRLRRWWGEVNSDADTFYHRHVSHDAKPTLAEVAKRRTKEKEETEEEKNNGKDIEKKAEGKKPADEAKVDDRKTDEKNAEETVADETKGECQKIGTKVEEKNA